MDREMLMAKALFWTKFSYILVLVFTVIGGISLILGVAMKQIEVGIPLVISVINLVIQIAILLGLFQTRRVLSEGNIPEIWPYILNIAYLVYSIIVSIINIPTAMESIPPELQSSMIPGFIVGYIFTVLQMIPPFMAWFKLRKISKLGSEDGK